MEPGTIIDSTGQERRLCLTPTPEEVRGRFTAFRKAVPTVPESEWEPIDHRDEFDESYVLDQKSHGSCVGFMAAGMAMKCRVMAGQTFQKLSGAYVYSFINGGRDQGASIGDSLGTLEREGTCLESEAGWDAIYPNRIPAAARQTAKRFLIEEGYRVDTWEEAVTAILKGYILGYAVHVGRNFDNLDSDDIIGFDSGPGNHAVHAYGLYKTAGGVWAIDGWNSWAMWGNKGRFRSTKKHWNGVQQDAYAIRAALWDPNDPNQPPVVK